MGIKVVVFVLLSTKILVQNVGEDYEDQYGWVRSGPPSPFQARSVRRRVSVSQPEDRQPLGETNTLQINLQT
jgi:hypothetical protein